jgi:hypothetical protein
MNSAAHQPLHFNLSESRGTARLMSAWELYAQTRRFERGEGLRDDGSRRRKGDDVSNRTGRGSTAKRTVFEMSVDSRMMVSVMRRHRRLVSGGTQFQQKRSAARRHEADGDIGTKQEDHQQQTGE